MTQGKLIHVLGTSSGAGKTTFAMAICRILKEKGYSVAPFKAMNMSLNSISTEEGEEISRAQWLQSKASGVRADWRMNPILLKPEGMGKSQVICKGASLGQMSIHEYGKFLHDEGRRVASEALNDLLGKYDFVVGEGSGSCAEINLYDRDISNTWITKEFNGTGILISNIESGGTFASLYGTKKLANFPETISYFVINNMRGNAEMLQSGIDFIENETGMRCLGVLPHIDHDLPGEDSLDYAKDAHGIVGVIRYPFFENYSDVDFLAANNLFTYVKNPREMNNMNTIILPGSKNVHEDIGFLKKSGLWEEIKRFHDGGGTIIGICGGYQILSRKIIFDREVEEKGLGLLDVEFVYSSRKTVTFGKYSGEAGGKKFSGDGYEIRYGQILENHEKPFLRVNSRDEGSVSENMRVIGTNVHGILNNRDFVEYLTGIEIHETYEEILEKSIRNFSNSVSANLKTSILSQIINGN